jgi:hypothetical protein
MLVMGARSRAHSANAKVAAEYSIVVRRNLRGAASCALVIDWANRLFVEADVFAGERVWRRPCERVAI